MENKNTFRKNLAKRRKELGMTQEQLAARINVSPQAISKWENTGYPDPETLPQLAKALNISLDSLFGVENTGEIPDIKQIVCNAVRAATPQTRSQIVMEVCYALISAYDPNSTKVDELRSNYERETFASVRDDHAIALARLNENLRYFFFVEKPENGVNEYFTNTKNMARLLLTLADEDAIRIVSYLGSGLRNKMHSVYVISKRLDIPQEKVKKVIDRLDRFGLVWRVCVDAEDGEKIMYGYTHSQPVAMILVLAESLSNYLQFFDQNWDNYSTGMFKDETGHNKNSIPQVSWWGEDEK